MWFELIIIIIALLVGVVIGALIGYALALTDAKKYMEKIDKEGGL